MRISRAKFGYIAEGCNYTPEDGQVLKQLCGDGRFVIIKNDRPMVASDLAEFYSTIGKLAVQPQEVIDSGGGVDGRAEFNKAGKGRLFGGKPDGELEWHCAGMNRMGGEDIVCMYMHQVAPSGGHTFYSDSQTAYTDLDDDTREMCDRLNSKYVTYALGKRLDATHYQNVFHDENTMLHFVDADGETAFGKQVSRKKLVTNHPINDKPGLYFPWSVIRGFPGISPEQQHDLYYRLKEHTLSEKYIYEHDWNNYDIIMSDQHHSLHRRDAYEGTNRELWRCGIWVNS